MKKIQLTPMQERKRKMFLVLPVLIIPFLTLGFYALGGGKGSATENRSTVHEGLNMELPDARLKDDKALTKMSYYDKASHDSAKREKLLKNDPYYKTGRIQIDSNKINIPDSNEEKALRKIAALDKAMNAKSAGEEEPSLYKRYERNNGSSTEAERLEKMMKDMEQSSGASADPDLNQLNGMLDKIMTIQHPERVTEELRQRSIKQKERAFPVSVQEPRNNISLLVDETISRSNPSMDTGFYSVDNFNEEVVTANSIEAVVHETRTVVNGSILKLRLLTDIFINGVLIPEGNFLFGKASLHGERLSIDIPSIRYKKSIFPVSLAVYDMDGLDGVFIPGAITRDVAKESSDRAIQGIALSSLDPSLGAQAASAGIEAAKSLLTKKVKLVKVVIKAGYRVLLKDKKSLS